MNIDKQERSSWKVKASSLLEEETVVDKDLKQCTLFKFPAQNNPKYQSLVCLSDCAVISIGLSFRLTWETAIESDLQKQDKH